MLSGVFSVCRSVLSVSMSPNCTCVDKILDCHVKDKRAIDVLVSGCSLAGACASLKCILVRFTWINF